MLDIMEDELCSLSSSRATHTQCLRDIEGLPVLVGCDSKLSKPFESKDVVQLCRLTMSFSITSTRLTA